MHLIDCRLCPCGKTRLDVTKMHASHMRQSKMRVELTMDRIKYAIGQYRSSSPIPAANAYTQAGLFNFAQGHVRT